MFFLLNASESLTRRDDLKTAITENMPKQIAFGLYPKKHTLFDQGKRTAFRALFIDALEDKYEETYDNITKAFQAGDPRLAGINLVPIKPTLKLNIGNIIKIAHQQNTFLAELAHLTVRGIKKLDEQMETIDGGSQTLREHFTTYIVEINGENQQLIHRSERATDDRIFLTFKKIHSQHVRKIIADLDKKLNTIFTPASLAASRSTSSMQVREINSVNTVATSANDDFLLALLSNPQNDTEDRDRPPPQQRSRRPIREIQPSEYPNLPATSAWKNNQRRKETNAPPHQEPEVVTLPQYPTTEATTALFQERAVHSQRMDKLERTLEELRQEAGHMRNLIEANKKAVLEEVEIKINAGNQQLTATLDKTMKDALSKISQQHTIFMAHQDITNMQMEKRQSQEILHRQEEQQELKGLMTTMITLFQTQTASTPSVASTHLPEQIAPATPRSKASRVRSPDAPPPRPAPYKRREETQDKEKDGWEDDDRDLDQTLELSPEGHPTPPSLSEEEKTA